MASLVADYASDSDSDQISDEDDNDQRPGPADSSIIVQSEEPAESSTKDDLIQPDQRCESLDKNSIALAQSDESTETSNKNFLISQNDEDESDSDDDGDDDHQDTPTKEKLPTPKIAKMKVAGIGKKKKKKVQPKPISSYKSNAVGSVWLNPYVKAEQKKQSVLEKHVKMTEVQILTGKKAKICRTFKQTGHCRFGKHCKYSHDIETISTCKPPESESSTGPAGPQDRQPGHTSTYRQLPPPPKPQQGFMGTVNTLHSRPHPAHGRHQRHQERRYQQQEQFMSTQGEEEVDDDKFQADKMRKKRVGVSQSLIPPKRALMSLVKQRAEERPWTMDDR